MTIPRMIPVLQSKQPRRTRRDTETPISRPVDMILRYSNLNPEVEVRPRCYHRLPLAQVASVRTWPVFRYIGALRIRDRTGASIYTLVADQDLTWIMSRMPRSTITPWVNIASGLPR